MEFNTKQELYDYLNKFDFDSIKDTKLSNVYFLVEFDNHIEPIYFTDFEDGWIAYPCYLHEYPLEDNVVEEYVKNMYLESWEDAYEYEKTMQRNGYHYEIDCPQCSPFLPDKIKIIDIFSDIGCLNWLLDRRDDTDEYDDYPCNTCASKDSCDDWEARFCCTLCCYCNDEPDCENCDSMDI